MKFKSPYGSRYWPRHRDMSPPFLILRIMITSLICYWNRSIFVSDFYAVYSLLVTFATVTGIANMVSFAYVVVANAFSTIAKSSFNKKQLYRLRISVSNVLFREGYLSSVGPSRAGTSTDGYFNSLLNWLGLESGMSSPRIIGSLPDPIEARQWVLGLSLERIALITMTVAFVSLVCRPASPTPATLLSAKSNPTAHICHLYHSSPSQILPTAQSTHQTTTLRAE